MYVDDGKALSVRLELSEMEPAWNDLSMGNGSKVFAEEGSVYEDEAASSVRGERIKGGEERVGLPKVGAKCLGFVTIVMGFLEKDDVGVGG